ncbi:hypothetical protein EVG20_g1270 [Dentipellis fragilis]|uniref:Uncharacterized protein n=1 Tax=Dentipellis fragilis TaxID=205917 RepID=A0A4Y9ZC51_9AGAM|nr:hypothetical protein EVG20_g1270 [Dentipellis fragilis]
MPYLCSDILSDPWAWIPILYSVVDERSTFSPTRTQSQIWKQTMAPDHPRDSSGELTIVSLSDLPTSIAFQRDGRTGLVSQQRVYGKSAEHFRFSWRQEERKYLAFVVLAATSAQQSSKTVGFVALVERRAPLAFG